MLEVLHGKYISSELEVTKKSLCLMLLNLLKFSIKKTPKQLTYFWCNYRKRWTLLVHFISESGSSLYVQKNQPK